METYRGKPTPFYPDMSPCRGWRRDPCAGKLGQADRTEIIRALPQRGIHLTSLSYLLNYCEATAVQQSSHLGRRKEAQPRLAAFGGDRGDRFDVGIAGLVPQPGGQHVIGDEFRSRRQARECPGYGFAGEIHDDAEPADE